MASQSFYMSHGASGFRLSDFTTGTNAPAGGDFELRWNTTDANGKNISREDIILFLKAAERMLEQGGATVDLLTLSGGAPPPPLV